MADPITTKAERDECQRWAGTSAYFGDVVPRMARHIDELESALTGHTVSCGACEAMQRKLNSAEVYNDALEKRLAELSEANAKLRAVYEVVANSVLQHDQALEDDLPAKAASFLEEQKNALAEFAPTGDGFSDLAGKIRALTWRVQMHDELRAENAKLRAALESGGEMFLAGQVAKLREERDRATKEADGYRKALQEAKAAGGKSVAAIFVGEGELRVFSESDVREELIGRTIVEWMNLIEHTALAMVTKERDVLRTELAQLRAKDTEDDGA